MARAGVIFLFLLSGSAYAAEKPPELWYWFKDLNKFKEACEIQRSYALQVMGLESQVENEYGIYGNSVKFQEEVVSGIAKTPAPPYYAVIFSPVRTDGHHGYW